MAENEKVLIDKRLLLEARVFVATEYFPPEENHIYFQTSLPTEEDYEEDDDVFYQEIIPEDVELEPSFSEKLFKLIKEKKISEVECYKNANIDRKLFSKIRSDDDYHPRKNTAISLALSLKLDLDETMDLLESAGYYLSRSIKSDVIIIFCIKKGIYNIIQVNEILSELGYELLNP